jgi:transposase
MCSLENNLQLDAKTLEVISQMEKEIDSKDQEINRLKTELEFLKSQVLNNKRKMYGASSEQISDGQLLLFNEAEKESDLKTEEPDIEEITYNRKKTRKDKKTKEESFENLETVVIEHKLDKSELFCDICESELTVIGKKTMKKLAYQPAKLFVEEHVTYTYACKSCEEESDEANIVRSQAPKSFLPKSMVSSELLSHILSLKYNYALPLYRQEKYFEMMNIKLSRQTLSNWVVRASVEFTPFYELLKEDLLKRNYIQADETTVHVINEDGKDAKAKKYMWMYRTGGREKPIILYDYQKTRSSSCPRNFLKGFNGYLQTDGYNGYNKVENVAWISCLAHIRRKFFEIVETLDDEAKKQSRALLGLNYCTKLYNIEKDIKQDYEYKDDYYEIRYKLRLAKSKLVLEEFINFVEEEIPNAVPRSSLGKALEYAKKQLPKLKIYLEDGRLEIDNNASERAIKPFVIGRKNWLFSNTPKGANASAIIYSIIETAKANGLQIEKYLTYIMNYIAKTDSKEKENLTLILPWSRDLPDDLKARGLEKK